MRIQAAPSLRQAFRPCDWVNDRLRSIAKKICGFALRVSVFQLGERRHCLGAFFTRVYRFFENPKVKGSIQPERLKRSIELLKEFGGIEAFLIPKDGQAKIHLMTFRSAAFFEAIDRQGGQRVQISPTQYVIRPKPGAPPEAFRALCSKLSKFFLVSNHDKTEIILPASPRLDDPNHPPIVLHCHSPGRAMPMDRKIIGLHIAAGIDFCEWDPRGTLASEGVPSEGGYYLDAEAAYEHVLAQGYPPNRVWLSGYCHGAAVVAHLKRKHHADGVHYIAESPYDTLYGLIQAYHWIGRKVGHLGMESLRSSDPAIEQRVEQDGFNNLRKLQELPRAQGAGRSILIHVDNDRTVPKTAIQKLREAIGLGEHFSEIQRRHPDPTVNGHMQPAREDPAVWHRYVSIIR